MLRAFGSFVDNAVEDVSVPVGEGGLSEGIEEKLLGTFITSGGRSDSGIYMLSREVVGEKVGDDSMVAREGGILENVVKGSHRFAVFGNFINYFVDDGS